MNIQVQQVIDRLEVMPKQGVAYDEKGRHGWRNPIRADTGGLLRALVKAKAPRYLLEIGTAHGLSGCYLASELPEGARMASIEWDAETAKQAQQNFDEAGLPVNVLCDNALGGIKLLAAGGKQFDFVFLDANKDGYFEQIKELQKFDLLSKGALIVADNVIDRASEMGDFLAWAKDHNAVTINTECGLLVATV